MTGLCGLLVMVCLLANPILAIIFVLKWIRKKPKKKIGIATIATFVGVFAFTLLGVAFDPSTNCEHQYEVENKIEATCTKNGYTSYHCPKCDDVEKKDKIAALGHDFKETSVREATEDEKGEIIRECFICRETKKEILKKLPKDKLSSQKEPKRENDISSETKASYTQEFELACDEIGIDVTKVTKWEQTDDWANGERFHFSYKRHRFIVYVNFDKTISSIELSGTEIYKRGYEAYSVEDFLVDEDIAEALIPFAQDTVKLALNYPSTADFSWFDWSYGREGDLYQLKSSVEAKNGFGVKGEIPFTVIFDIGVEGKAKCVYLLVDGGVVANDIPNKPERKKVESVSNHNDIVEGKIRLIDGELGKYGKKDNKYPEYIDFFVPLGKYKVENNAKNSIVMIIDNTNNDEISRITLTTSQSGEIKVGENQHIELTIYSDVTLTMISEYN